MRWSTLPSYSAWYTCRIVGEVGERYLRPRDNGVAGKYQVFEESVRKGQLGKTAVFWMSVIDQAHLLFMLQHSVKTNKIKLFHYCNGEMTNLFFAFDGHSYSRYTP